VAFYRRMGREKAGINWAQVKARCFRSEHPFAARQGEDGGEPSQLATVRSKCRNRTSVPRSVTTSLGDYNLRLVPKPQLLNSNMDFYIEVLKLGYQHCSITQYVSIELTTVLWDQGKYEEAEEMY
jgi:hypothetical protein